MMNHREEVIELCRTNLKYALTGDNNIIDSYAIENQICIYHNEIDVLMERVDKTQGSSERYEKEITNLYEKISILRDRLNVIKSQSSVNEEVDIEIERFVKAMREYDSADFTEYNDSLVRRIIEYIKVMPDRSIEVVLKGGMKEVEKV